MKKLKQLFAILGILFLVSLYIITLVLAITDNTSTRSMFAASVIATIVIPILLWIYIFIYKMINKKDDTDSE